MPPKLSPGLRSLHACCSCFLALLLAGITGSEAGTLRASDGGTGDAFGYSVSISGTNGLVGAYEHDPGGVSNQGAAYVFDSLDTRTGVTSEVRELTASGTAGDRFGISVSLSGTSGLFGAPGANLSRNAAYFYGNVFDTAAQPVQLAVSPSSNLTSNAAFGTAVSLAGSTGLVGAYNHSGGEGAAFLYRNLGATAGPVTENLVLRPAVEDRAQQINFGNAVSLSANNALVAAY